MSLIFLYKEHYGNSLVSIKIVLSLEILLSCKFMYILLQGCHCSAIVSITIAQQLRKMFQGDREIDHARHKVTDFGSRENIVGRKYGQDTLLYTLIFVVFSPEEVTLPSSIEILQKNVDLFHAHVVSSKR